MLGAPQTCYGITPLCILSPRNAHLKVMFKDHRESGSTSFRELPGSMLGTELHVYRRASRDGFSRMAVEAGRTGLGVEVGIGVQAGVGAGSGPERSGRMGSLGYSKEALSSSLSSSPPQSFALLTSMGIYHGSLALGSQVCPCVRMGLCVLSKRGMLLGHYTCERVSQERLHSRFSYL